MGYRTQLKMKIKRNTGTIMGQAHTGRLLNCINFSSSNKDKSQILIDQEMYDLIWFGLTYATSLISFKCYDCFQ